MLKQLETACTCPSFWQVVREQEARQDPAGAPEDKTYTNFLDVTREDNESLSVLGNHLLGVFALEWLESRYPNLPERLVLSARKPMNSPHLLKPPLLHHHSPMQSDESSSYALCRSAHMR